tara:strand:- start:21024 stop:21476 length:453 start_codon:yes stop_codon:yes gene_type:complete
MENNFWRKCSTCKKEIGFNAIYQKCSVSTCRKNVYCSVTCWDVHNPIMNHKSSWAEEERAPSKEQAASEREPRRIIVSAAKPTISSSSNDFPIDTLIVASKLKNYIKEKHDMNTSANVMDKLSELVRELSDQAVIRARQDGRKTLMDRDF